MSIRRLFILPSFLLAGCAGLDAGPWAAWSWPFPPAASLQGQGGGVAPASARGDASTSGYARFDFGWQLEGDPEIMPVQAFDDGERTWLQFSSEGAWPAVFEAGAAGWRPLPYRREGPYMVLEGVHERLELRGGHLRGAVHRAGPGGGRAGMAAQAVAVQPGVSSGEAALPAVVPADAGPVQGKPERKALVQSDPLARSLAALDALQAAAPAAATAANAAPAVATANVAPRPGAGGDTYDARAMGVQDRADGAAAIAGVAHFTESSFPPSPETSAFPESSAEPAGGFFAGPADLTMRQALARWATTAGWTFTAEHWAVDVDIPLVGQASFPADFKAAVRDLLASTEMGDRPLQPCFYSNRVVRVVPYAQACDRRNGMGSMS